MYAYHVYVDYKYVKCLKHSTCVHTYMYVHTYVWMCTIVNADVRMLTGTVDTPSHSNTSTGFILGALPRHCILHVLTVIKEAMFKV